VWHRDPDGVWTSYSTVIPELGCSRYFGREITQSVVTQIDIEWIGSIQFLVSISTALRWEVRLAESLPGRLMNSAASLIPDPWWQKKSILKAMGGLAQFVLGIGKMNLTGKTPNGHNFIANPQRVWLIDSSRAVLNGQDLGSPGPLSRQARLNDVFIPQRGVFAVARAYLQTPRQTSSMFPVHVALKPEDISELL
jgi:hypothetical protein